MAFPWAAVGGIAGAIGSLFGGDDDEPQVTKTKTRTNYRQMAKDAMKGGFNPLTVLRNGGAAGHSTTVSTMPALSSPSTGERIAGAVGSFADGMAAQESWNQAQQRADLENQLIGAQIQRLRQPVTGPVGGGLSTRTSPGQGPGQRYPLTGTPGATTSVTPGSLLLHPQLMAPPRAPGDLEPNYVDTVGPDGVTYRGPNMENQGDAETELWWQYKMGVVLDEQYNLLQHNLENSSTWDRFNDFMFGPPGPDGYRFHMRPHPGLDVSGAGRRHGEATSNAVKKAWDYWEQNWDSVVDRWGPDAWGDQVPNPLQQPRDPLPLTR